MAARRVVLHDDDGAAYVTPGVEIVESDFVGSDDQAWTMFEQDQQRELDEDAEIDARRDRGMDDYPDPTDEGRARDLASTTLDPHRRESPQPRGMTDEQKRKRAIWAQRSREQHERSTAEWRADPPRILARKLGRDDAQTLHQIDERIAAVDTPADERALLRRARDTAAQSDSSVVAVLLDDRVMVARAVEGALALAGVDMRTDVPEAFRSGRPTKARKALRLTIRDALASMYEHENRRDHMAVALGCSTTALYNLFGSKP